MNAPGFDRRRDQIEGMRLIVRDWLLWARQNTDVWAFAHPDHHPDSRGCHCGNATDCTVMDLWWFATYGRATQTEAQALIDGGRA